MSFLSKLLPTIGSLLGGPLGSAAAEAAGRVLGMSEPTVDKVKAVLSAGNLSPEQMAELQAADVQLQARLAELGLDAQKLTQLDRADARAMQTATASWVPSVLACSVTVGFFGILVGLLTGDLKLWESTTLSLLIGSLSTAFSSVLAFYYGASHKPPEK